MALEEDSPTSSQAQQHTLSMQRRVKTYCASLHVKFTRQYDLLHIKVFLVGKIIYQKRLSKK
ncbi:hypothetical protein BABINDRAFT_162425 [Babjeviella inositovora NRRL Y-12698]|uniref:Uncharacterized protein n=1 Tax=Babjeviella inositovora NRRL Y-12698 TaxID=984486 RepID=A0A1E3QM13_9ASCO|nr:uncharacterized protein BABINDRAFT_162425 [Babjeviella inositovora NRRL Y-12698]ODQ78733.1 hypothetical protein BABINDRAFT_162425 [Babjeviella inositovora NRRL Y-12698]